jgi:serine/threonine protein kinase
MTLSDTIAKYKNIAGASSQFSNAVARQENLNGWLAYRDESCRGQRKTPQHLGRFIIRKHLRHPNGVFEYCALDEPPCQMEVLLREFPFDPTLPASELQKHLRAVAREARVLMKLRHPYIACVIGHFQTGSSWVQVSDWFEGERLEDSWSLVAESSALDKIGIFLKLLDALEFCHERGVFHRNVGAEAVCVAPDLSDVRLFAFDCALDLDGTLTTNAAASIRRNPRLIAPEDLHGGPATNPRLSDIFQTGVLLYRLLENGEWPFENTFEYATSGAGIRPFLTTDADRETRILREAAVRMLDLRPESRPDLLSKIKQELQNLLA